MIIDCKQIVEYLRVKIKNHTEVAVIGLSGGADSTLAAILCSMSLGKDNVYGISMPYSQQDSATFNSRSENLARKLGICHRNISCREVGDSINRAVERAMVPDKITNVNSGNSRSRARMCILYGLAHHLASSNPDQRVRVVGTGNLSEDYIGYDTKGGDSLSDFFPLGDLFKSEVYQLLDYFIEEGTISEENVDRIPSAGLEDLQTDEGDLSREFGGDITYKDMEVSIRKFLRQGSPAVSRYFMTEADKFVFERHRTNEHKHLAPPTIPCRYFCD